MLCLDCWRVEEELQDQGLAYPATVDLGRDLWNVDHIDCVGVVLQVVEEPFVAAVRSSSCLHLASAETGGGQDAEEAAGKLQVGLHPHRAGVETYGWVSAVWASEGLQVVYRPK